MRGQPGQATAGAVAEAPPVLRLQTARDRAAALAAVASTVEDWNGEWTAAGDGGGELRLPVEAGLRRGFVRGRVTATAAAAGSELALEIVESRWWVHRVAVALLLGAAIPASAGVLWPFVPAVAPLVPLGLVLGAAAWLAILARLRHRGPAEFLSDVEAALDEGTTLAAAAGEDAPPAPISPR
ncbi:MAG TPA: hypothetical protein VGS57_00810 [Thermoanaerobaculia bacterium]|jgi:hypothetical protein|nr:hypothetical protein [Thermoanaerobaculia bacterium]